MSKLPAHVLELLEVVERAVAPLGVPYAIGGAVAMSVHGYRRSTDDVDLFVLDEDCGAVLRALRGAGMSVSPISSPSQYMAKFPDETDPDIRIDILVAIGDPEESAVAMPVTATFGGKELHIFSAELLALSKFYSGRPDDLRDLSKLYELGLFDVDEARRLLALMNEEELTDFNAALRVQRRARVRPPRRPR